VNGRLWILALVLLAILAPMHVTLTAGGVPVASVPVLLLVLLAVLGAAAIAVALAVVTGRQIARGRLRLASVYILQGATR
jgi:hypothetical protein